VVLLQDCGLSIFQIMVFEQRQSQALGPVHLLHQ
jgi:hypothetical protein